MPPENRRLLTLVCASVATLAGAGAVTTLGGCRSEIVVQHTRLASGVCQAEAHSLGLPTLEIGDAQPGDRAELVESMAQRQITATEDEEKPKVEERQETRRTTLQVKERRADGSAVVERTVDHAGCRFVQLLRLAPGQDPQVLSPTGAPAPARSRLPVPPSFGARDEVLVRQSSTSVEAAPETCITASVPQKKRNVGQHLTERAEEVIFCPDLPLGLPFARLVELREQRLDRPELFTRRIYRLRTTGARAVLPGRMPVDPRQSIERWKGQLQTE